jgi:hypothetical protein
MCQLQQKVKHKANQPLPATSNSQASKHAQVEEVYDKDSSSLQLSISSALPQLSNVSSFLLFVVSNLSCTKSLAGQKA